MRFACEHAWWTEDKDALMLHTVTKDEVIFDREMRLYEWNRLNR